MFQPKVTGVDPLSDYNVLVTFDTGEQKIFDVNPYINGEWYGKLKNVKYFNTVRAAGRTIEWIGGQDIAPHELYDYSVTVSGSSN